MATRHSGVTELSGKQNLLIDVLALMLLPWFGAIHYGAMTSQVTVFGGYDLGGALWTVAGVDISISLLVMIFSVAWILGTNELDGSDYEPLEFAIIAFALLAPVLHVFVPAFSELVAMNGFSKLMFTGATSAAATLIAYTD